MAICLGGASTAMFHTRIGLAITHGDLLFRCRKSNFSLSHKSIAVSVVYLMRKIGGNSWISIFSRRTEQKYNKLGLLSSSLSIITSYHIHSSLFARRSVSDISIAVVMYVCEVKYFQWNDSFSL